MQQGIIKPFGGVSRAIASYDRNIRTRWSHEKKKWVLEAPVKRSDLMIPPIRFVPSGIEGQYYEELLPELSDRRICYRDRFDPLFWCKTLTWEVFDVLVKSDSHRFKSREEFLRYTDKEQANREQANEKEEYDKNQDLNEQAQDKYKFLTNRYLWMDPVGGLF